MKRKDLHTYMHVFIVYGIIVVFCGLPGPQEDIKIIVPGLGSGICLTRRDERACALDP